MAEAGAAASVAALADPGRELLPGSKVVPAGSQSTHDDSYDTRDARKPGTDQADVFGSAGPLGNTGSATGSSTGGSSTPRQLDETLLTSLTPPPPYALHVESLSIQAPPPPVQIPFTVPINLPYPVARKLGLGGNIPPAKTLLDNVHFSCSPGEVLAIIGGSGSGKTTALNAAALRTANLVKTAGQVSFLPLENTRESRRASKAINAGSSSSRSTGSVVGYVRQDDFLLPYLSVKETLDFAASLRLPTTVSQEAREAIVQQTMAELGLSDVATVIVGGTTGRKGISGGERRRLSIGCILVTLPSVLLLDEPTTGLDATTAFHLLQLLSNLSRRNRTIVLTIHQPRSDAFMLFDRLCLLSSGQVIYSGPRSDVLPYFAELDHEPSLHTNPLDFLLDISSVDQRSDEAEVESTARVQALAQAWKNSHSRSDKRSAEVEPDKKAKRDSLVGHFKNLLRDAPGHVSGDQEEQGRSAPSSAIQSQSEKIRRPGLIKQSRLLTRRAVKNLLRDKSLLFGFLLQAIVIGLMTGVEFYLGAGPTSPNEVQTFKTVIFQSHSAFFYLSIVLNIYLQCQSLVIFDRERDDGLYGAVPYVVSLISSYLPVNIISPGIYAIIIYFMCGFRRDDLARNLFIWLGDYWMNAQAILGYALLMTSLIRTFAEASMLGNALSIIFVICAGYLIVNLPGYIAWTRFFAPYYYGFHWTAISQLRGRVFQCDGSQAGTAAASQCDGDQVIDGLNFQDYPIRVYPLGLLGFILVVFCLATLALHFLRPGGVRFAQQQLAARPAKGDDMTKEKRNSAMIKAVSRAGPVELKLRNLHLVVEQPRLRFGRRRHYKDGRETEKVIIEDISARFQSGKVAAILGPSGSGKTSLLQLLAGRLAKASAFRREGDILFNGRAQASSSTRSLTGFVEQHDDHHLPALTVRETLHYAAKLRLRGMSKSAKAARAEEILRALGLKACADNLVGGELVKGISGGEKRRLSLAVELLADPAVLLVDEPTSGLDAYNARSVMQVLREIADTGRTVVVSIHQPSSEIWTTFDDALVLAKGGKTVTFSPRTDILNVFRNAGEDCPAFYNPADFILDTVAIDARNAEAKQATTKRLEYLIQGARAYQAERGLEEGASRQHGQAPPEQHNPTSSISNDTKFSDFPSQSFAVAFPVVLSRAFKNLRRQKDVFVVRLFNPPFLALLFWLFFLRLSKGPEGAQNRVGLLQENGALPFVGMLTAVAIFPKERDAFYHERISAARYSTFTFLLSYTMQELPMQIFAALVYSIIMVYGMALQGSARIFFEFAICIWGALNFGESVGIIFCSWITSGGLSISVVSVFLTIQAQASGIMSVSIPHWVQVIAWAAPIKYLSRIQIINEMEGLTFNCDAASIASGLCIAETGEQLLDTFRIIDRDTGKFLGIFIAVVVIYRLLAYAALSLRVMTL